MSGTLPSNEILAGQNSAGILPESEAAGAAFATLYTIVARLRAPDGCPWDREQTPSSIRNNIVEEAYELVEAITEKDDAHVREESGDLFLLASMVAYMCEQSGAFKVSEALAGISEKLVRRHPHVFGDSVADTPDAVVTQWNDIKESKEGRRKKDSVLDEVPRHLPPLEKAYKLQKKAAKVGFDWITPEDVWGKLEEEIREAREAWRDGTPDELEGELGDMIYSLVNLSRRLGVDPTIALQRTNDKFLQRFRYMEKSMKGKGLPLDSAHFAEMDALWDEAKLVLSSRSKEA
jgi:tetrapyrrole methylase family protein/MazG family protein